MNPPSRFSGRREHQSGRNRLRRRDNAVGERTPNRRGLIGLNSGSRDIDGAGRAREGTRVSIRRGRPEERRRSQRTVSECAATQIGHAGRNLDRSQAGATECLIYCLQTFMHRHGRQRSQSSEAAAVQDFHTGKVHRLKLRAATKNRSHHLLDRPRESKTLDGRRSKSHVPDLFCPGMHSHVA